ILGQEAVARMDGIGSSLASNGDDLLGPQIAFARRRSADAESLTRCLQIRGLRVGLREYRHRCNVELAERADDTGCSGSAIGDQYLVERPRHAGSPARRCGFPLTLACFAIANAFRFSGRFNTDRRTALL